MMRNESKHLRMKAQTKEGNGFAKLFSFSILFAFLLISVSQVWAQTCGQGDTAGMISYWKGEGNANDTLGALNGVWQGNTAPAYDTGKVGSAFDFESNGFASYRFVNVEISPIIMPSYSLEAWVYPRRTDAGGGLIGLWDQPGTSPHAGLSSGYSYFAPSNVFEFGGSPAWTGINSSNYNANQWYHVIGTYDASTQAQNLYINGILAANRTVSLDNVMVYHIFLGDYRGSGDPRSFTGLLDEVAIYNRSLTDGGCSVGQSCGGDIGAHYARTNTPDSQGYCTVAPPIPTWNGLSVSNLTTNPGEPVNVLINLTNAVDIAGLQFALSYPTFAAYNGIQATARAVGGTLLANQTTPGILRIAWIGMSGSDLNLYSILAGTGTIYNITLLTDPAAPGGDYPMKLLAVVMSSIDAQQVSATLTNGTFSVNVFDTTPPTIVSTSVTPNILGTGATTINITKEVRDGTGVKSVTAGLKNSSGAIVLSRSLARISGTAASGNWSAIVDIGSLPDGVYTIIDNATDTSSNNNSRVVTDGTVSLDRTAPIVILRTITPQYTKSGGSVVDNIQIKDDTSGISAVAGMDLTTSQPYAISLYSGSSSAGQIGYYHGTFAAQGAGSHSLQATVTDAAGNVQVNTINNAFSVDDAAPTVSISADKSGTISDAYTSLNFSCQDEVGGSGSPHWALKVNKDGTYSTLNGASPTSPYTYVFDQGAGNYSFKIECNDSAGNSASDETVPLQKIVISNANNIQVNTSSSNTILYNPVITVTSQAVTIADANTPSVSYVSLPVASYDMGNVQLQVETGKTIIRNVGLAPGETKSARVKIGAIKDDKNYTVCIVDSDEATMVSSLGCDGGGEVLVDCNGELVQNPTTGANYTCTYESINGADYVYITGLQHSLIQEWGLPLGITISPPVVSYGVVNADGSILLPNTAPNFRVTARAYYTDSVAPGGGPVYVKGAYAEMKIVDKVTGEVVEGPGMTFTDPITHTTYSGLAAQGYTGPDGYFTLGPIGPVPVGEYNFTMAVQDGTYSGEPTYPLIVQLVVGQHYPDLWGTISMNEVTYGQYSSVPVTFTVRNQGDRSINDLQPNINAVPVRIELMKTVYPYNDVYDETTTVPASALTPGGSSGFSRILLGQSAGTYTLKMTIDDPDNSLVVESTKNNNVVSKSVVFSADGPNLQPVYAETTPAPIICNNDESGSCPQVELKVTVKNTGNLDVSPGITTNAHAYLDGPEIGSPIVVNPLNKGDSQDLYFTFPSAIKYGSHTISFTVDTLPGGEQFITDNSISFTRKWYSPKPDFMVSYLYVPTTQGVYDATMHARITNNEIGVPESDFDVEIYVDGDLKSTQRILKGWVGPLGGVDITYPMLNLGEGPHSVSIEVDPKTTDRPYGEVDESFASAGQTARQEDNNHASTGFTIRPSDPLKANLQVRSGDISLLIGGLESSRIKAGEPGTISALIHNLGPGESLLTYINTSFDSTQIGLDGPLSILYPGSYAANSTFTAPPGSEPGSMLITTVKVTSSNEVNYADNIATRGFEIKGPRVTWMSPSAGSQQEGYFTLTVKAEPLVGSVEFYYNGNLIDTVSGEADPQAHTWSLVWNSAAVEHGDVSLRAVAYGKGEDIGISNDASITVHVDNRDIPNIDFQPTDLQLSKQPSDIIPGDLVDLTAYIHNGGSDALNTLFTVDFYDNNVHIGPSSTMINSIAAGGTETATTSWTATAGPHTIKVVVNQNHGIIETNYDNNEMSLSLTVDNQPPITTITTTPSSPNGLQGWFTHNVDVNISASDLGGSGVKNIYYCNSSTGAPRDCSNLANFVQHDSTPVQFTVSAEGTTTVYAYSTDNAGNTETEIKSLPIKVDQSIPQVSISPSLLPSIYSASSFQLEWTANDNDEILSFNVYETDNGALSLLGTTAGTSMPISGLQDGHAYGFYVNATDPAGNKGTSNTLSTTIDLAPPLVPQWKQMLPLYTNKTTVHLEWNPSSDPAGILRYNITRNGVQLTTVPGSQTYYDDSNNLQEPQTYIYTISATDNSPAQHESDYSVPTNTTIDLTAPALGHVITPLPIAEWNGLVLPTITLTATEGVSGLAEFKYNNGSGWQDYNSEFQLPDNQWTIQFYAIDGAGNRRDSQFSVWVDTVAPVTTDDAPAGWQSSAVDVTLTPTDTGGSGIAETRYCVSPSAECYQGSVGPVATVTDQGFNFVKYHSVDVAGNVEENNTVQVKIDLTAPNTTTEYSYVSKVGETYTSDVIATLTADDNGLSGVPADGTRYSIDNSVFSTYTQPVVFDQCAMNCSYIFEYYSVDNLGHEELPHHVDTINIDKRTANVTLNESGGTVSNIYGDASYYVPLGAISEPKDMTIVPDSRPFAAINGVDPISQPYDLGPAGIIFNSPVTITMKGDCSSGEIDFSSQCIAKYYDVDQQWRCISACQPDLGALIETGFASCVTEENGWIATWDFSNTCTLSAQTDRFSIYRVIRLTDIFAPNTAVTLVPAAPNGDNGWYKLNVGVGLNATDDANKIWPGRNFINKTFYDLNGNYPTTEYTGTINLPEGRYNISYYSVDNAGNAEQVKNKEIYVDTTSPNSTAIPQGTEGKNGWFWSSVGVNISADDSTSGVSEIYFSIDSSSGPWENYSQTGVAIVDGEGRHTVYYYAADAAGNNEDVDHIDINIDWSAPNTTINLDGTVGADGWYMSDVDVTLTTEDNIAVSGSECNLDSQGWTSFVPFQLHEGTHELYCHSEDPAGNVGDDDHRTIKIDTTDPLPPAVTELDIYTKIPEITVTWKAPTQPVSEIANYTVWKCSSATTGCNDWTSISTVQGTGYTDRDSIADGMFYYYKVTATSGAGRTSGDSNIVNTQVDLVSPTKPQLYSISPTGFINTTYADVSWKESTDPGLLTSGFNYYKLYEGDVDFGGIHPAFSTIFQPIYVTTYGHTGLADAKSYYYKVSAVDKAGNEGDKSDEENVTVDTTAPVTKAAIIGTPRKGWYNNSVSVQLTASDDADRLGVDISGVASTEYNLNNGAWQPYSLIQVADEGLTTVYFHSADVAGNVETPKTIDVQIDTTPPNTTVSNVPPDWVNYSVSITISANDSVPGIKTSGVEITNVCIDQNNTCDATQEIPAATLGEGVNYIKYFSIDNAGNVESRRVAVVKIDTTAPTTSASVSGTVQDQPYDDTYKDTATVTLTATDEKVGLNTSNVAATSYRINNGAWTQCTTAPCSFQVTTQGENTVQFYSIDVAGNAESIKSITVRIDKDTDGDGLYDNFDACDTNAGFIAYQGCPVGDSNEVVMHIVDQLKSGECGCKGTVQFKTKEFRYGTNGSGCTVAQLEKYPGRDSRDYFECSNAAGFTTITVHSATIAQSGIKTNKVKINGRDISNFVYQGTDSAGLYVWQTRVPQLSSKDRLQVYFKAYKTLAGADCKPASTCQESIDQAEIRVFNRNDPAFKAAWTSDPKATNYPAIFDTATAIASCTTDETGTCIAGETATGSYLVIARYSDDELNKTVYIGRPKEPDDFKDTNKDGIKDLAYKDFRVTKTIKKTGEMVYTASGKIAVTGSLLEIIKPDYTLWTNTEELYPFIFTSDSEWSVDVCLYTPQGYSISNVMDAEGNLLPAANCTQTFVANETKTILFTLLETGSPEPDMSANITLVNPYGVASVVSLDIPGQRIKAPFDAMLAALIIGAVVIVAIVIGLITMKGKKNKKE